MVSKLEQAMYLAEVRLMVMEQTPADPEDRHWIADDVCTDMILRYAKNGYDVRSVTHALVDAYRAVERMAVEN